VAISFDDIRAAFPAEAKAFTAEQAAPFLEAANLGFPDSRFKTPAMADRGRVNYVMHMLTKPKLNLGAPHILAQMGAPKPRMKKPHVWDGTKFGVALKKAVKA
jgi:hypothetical protein